MLEKGRIKEEEKIIKLLGYESFIKIEQALRKKIKRQEKRMNERLEIQSKTVKNRWLFREKTVENVQRKTMKSYKNVWRFAGVKCEKCCKNAVFSLFYVVKFS